MEKMPLPLGSEQTAPKVSISPNRAWWARWKRALGIEEEGQGLMEYALVLFFIAVVVIAVLIVLGPQIGSMFSAVTKGFS